MRESSAMRQPDGLSGSAPLLRPTGGGARRRGGGSGRLAVTVLAHLPLAVAVLDSDARLVFWNQQAAGLFNVPALMAAGSPALADILANVSGLTPDQRDLVVEFCQTHIAAGDRTEPQSRIRLSLARGKRIAMAVHGIGSHQWMLIIEDIPCPLGSRSGGNARDDAADASLDPLTGVGNRRHFIKTLRSLVDRATPETRHALLLIDLDRFKPVNDTFGYPIGDALLCLVAQRLRREIRDDDILVRLGGDQFAILIGNGAGAEILAARIVAFLGSPFLVEGHVVHIGASVGIARFPEHGPSADDLLGNAELVLAEAKSAGGQKWRMFETALAATVNARRDLETELRKALKLSEMSVAYQPQINVKSRTVTGFEALLRWNHPTLGAISPATFIPVAEEIGCIAAMGEFVLKTACQEAARWPAPLFVAVNVSPRQFEDGERLLGAVTSALQASGLDPGRLELEVTESSLLARDGTVLDTLRRLREAGVRIAMDDFGTGYSSLGQLRSYPFTKIKIDRSFIGGLGADPQAGAVIRAIASLGLGLGMTTTAEGVETPQQAALVEADGCTDIQGYLYSRPISPADIDDLLRRMPPRPDINPDRTP